MNQLSEEPIVTAVPGRSYWLLYLFLVPAGGAILGAILAAPYHFLFHKGDPNAIIGEILAFGPIGAILVFYFGAARDRKKLRCDLYADHLVLGSGIDKEEILF